MTVRRRFGVRATAPDAMARNLALLRAFRDLERRRVTVGAVMGVLVVAVVASTVAGARPGWPATIVALGVAACLFAAVTFGVAAILRPRRVSRALGAYRSVVRDDARRWMAETGEPKPATPARARAWLETHPGAGGSADLPRIELLVWIGEYETARRVIASLPSASSDERFERSLRAASVDFTATGDGDLGTSRAARDEVPEAARPMATARLAVEESRQLAAAFRGGAARAGEAAGSAEYLEPLVRARDGLGSAVAGSLLLDLARWVARPLLILGAISAVTSFVVAGALPPR